MSTELLADTWLTKPYSEVIDVANSEGSILVIPVGSLEQHGDHLPTGTDTILAMSAARVGMEELDDIPILCSPPIWTGYSPHHLPFGGSVTLEHDTFIDTITDIVDSAAGSGFDAVVLLNGHGGNKPLLSTAITVAGRSNPEVEVSTFLYLELLSDQADKIQRSEMPGVHGGELETSLMLALRPDWVDEEKASATAQEEPYERTGSDLLEGGPVSVYRPFDSYTDTGTLGDSTTANSKTGEQALDIIASEIATILHSIHEEVKTDEK